MKLKFDNKNNSYENIITFFLFILGCCLIYLFFYIHDYYEQFILIYICIIFINLFLTLVIISIFCLKI
jgi:VIT1/CCC1 family predicted Fe2+/Mn2+ transporter